MFFDLAQIMADSHPPFFGEWLSQVFYLQESITMKKTKRPLTANLGYLLIFLAFVCWGTEGFFVTNLRLQGARPFIAGFCGHFYAILPLIIFILFFLGPSGFKISKNGLIYALVLGVVTKAFFKMAYNTAIGDVGVSTAAVLVSTQTIWTAMLSVIFFKEKLYPNNYLAIIVNIIGVLFVVTLGNFTSLNLAPLGVFLGLFSAFLNGISAILTKKSTQIKDNPLTIVFYTLLISTITLAFVSKPWAPENIGFFTNKNFLLFAIPLGLLTGALPNVLYFFGMAAPVDTSKTPVVATIDVVVATMMGVFVFKEKMNLIGIIGIGLIFLSITLMNRDRNKYST